MVPSGQAIQGDRRYQSHLRLSSARQHGGTLPGACARFGRPRHDRLQPILRHLDHRLGRARPGLCLPRRIRRPEPGEATTSRIQIDAACEIVDEARGTACTIYLTAPCRSEFIIADDNLFQVPNGEFRAAVGDAFTVTHRRRAQLARPKARGGSPLTSELRGGRHRPAHLRSRRSSSSRTTRSSRLRWRATRLNARVHLPRLQRTGRDRHRRIPDQAHQPARRRRTLSGVHRSSGAARPDDLGMVRGRRPGLRGPRGLHRQRPRGVHPATQHRRWPSASCPGRRPCGDATGTSGHDWRRAGRSAPTPRHQAISKPGSSRRPTPSWQACWRVAPDDRLRALALYLGPPSPTEPDPEYKYPGGFVGRARRRLSRAHRLRRRLHDQPRRRRAPAGDLPAAALSGRIHHRRPQPVPGSQPGVPRGAQPPRTASPSPGAPQPSASRPPPRRTPAATPARIS